MELILVGVLFIALLGFALLMMWAAENKDEIWKRWK